MSGGQNSPGQSPSNPLAVTGPPEESSPSSLLMDSNDTVADGNPGNRRAGRGQRT